MAKPLGSLVRQLGGFHSQIWKRIQELAEDQSETGMSELLSLVSVVRETKVNVLDVQTRLEVVPSDELVRLLKSSLFQEPEKPVVVSKSKVTRRGRSGRSSTEEEKQAILHLLTSRELTDEIEIKGILKTEMGFPDVTPRSIKMIISRVLKNEAVDSAEMGHR